MIASLSGKLTEKRPTEVVVDVSGVGYRVFIPTSTYDSLPEAGSPVSLLTHLIVREDALTLYGFASSGERSIFELLIGVSGVGPKTAQALLSRVNAAELRDLVAAGDVQILTSIPGVGRKTAERLVVELRDKMATLEVAGGAANPLGGASDVAAAARADALAALEQLGFNRAAAERSLRKALRSNPGLRSADEMVRLALRDQG